MNLSWCWSIKATFLINQIQKKLIKIINLLKTKIYSTSHTVKDGESLSEIINKFYGNTGLNMRIIQLSLTEINKHAFVRNNPNYLFAGKKLKIPSINEIMNLVKNKPNQRKTSGNRGNNHIYFYGN